jgi:hypothetical protein
MNFSFVVRNLNTEEDSRWIELDRISKEEAMAEWDRIVDQRYDWEIVDLECSFPVNYYDYQYANFETLYNLYTVLEEIKDNDAYALIAAQMLDESEEIKSISDIEKKYEDTHVILAGSGEDELARAVVEIYGYPKDTESYFDYDYFGRDLAFQGFGDDEDEDEDEDEDYSEIAENYIDSIGGIENLSKDTLEIYFDFYGFGRDLLFEYDYYEIAVDGRIIEGWISTY